MPLRGNATAFSSNRNDHYLASLTFVMGKWTLEYHDEVLRNKVKNLVQGSIKRMKVEDEGPTITYESFVQDLDEGDSFTTSLVDVLVKELAERRMRPNPGDRRLISERTAKSLRLQAAPSHVYRGNQGLLRDRNSRRSVPLPRPRSRTNLHDVLSDSDPETEYGTMFGSAAPVEGVRLNTDLYEAYFPSTFDLPGSLSRDPERIPTPPQPQPSDPTTSGGSWIIPSPPSRSPPTLYGTSGPAWTGLGGPGAPLNRSSTIRRPHRTRTTDLSDFASFTSRRRSAIRNTATQEDGSHEGSSTDRTGGSAPADSTRSTESSTVPGDSSSSRLWNLNALTRHGRSSSSSYDDGGHPTGSHPSSSQMWYNMTSAANYTVDPSSLLSLPRRSSTTDLNEDRRQAIAPRLRRGGLRPPEAMLPTSSQGFLERALVEHASRVASREPTRVDSVPPQSGLSDGTVAEQSVRSSSNSVATPAPL
ncbi:hypothetical protein C8Q80DRAFT_1268345 [Daedaleopsis nitida]|nr:hypothetical protein C8Q80DRAFT_1268345 [Daedaleopsis nitida]